MLPQLALPSPKLADSVCEVWAMIFCPEWLNVGMMKRFVGVLEELRKTLPPELKKAG